MGLTSSTLNGIISLSKGKRGIKMFLLGWMIDGILTVIGCILLACAFGNSPITFLFFFVFPIVFILIWCKIFVNRG